MERLVKVGEFKIKTDVPHEECMACAAVSGEMSVFVVAVQEKTLLVDQDLETQVECHARSGKSTSRHLAIVLKVGEEEIAANRVVRNWGRRRVHCGIK